jgi:hypothetical protein
VDVIVALLEKGVPMRYCSEAIWKFDTEYVVAIEGTRQTALLEVESASDREQGFPHTEMKLFAESIRVEARPLWAMVSMHPPANEHWKFEAMLEAVIALVRVDVPLAKSIKFVSLNISLGT